MVTLRDYQEKQLDFLRKWGGRGVTYLQSPTGSGKSLVMIEYAKEYLRSHPQKTFYIATGFNELVWQLAETAKWLGMDPVISIAGSNASCLKAGAKSSDPVFYKNNTHRKGNRFCGTCEMREGNVCPYMRHVRSSFEGKLVITNHSKYLASHMATCTEEDPDPVFIDEAHVFEGFYEHHVSVEITREELESVIINLRKDDETAIYADVVRQAIDKDFFDPDPILDICPALENISDRRKNMTDGKPSTYTISSKLNGKLKKYKDYTSMWMPDIYVHPNYSDGKFLGAYAEVFFSSVSGIKNVCLVSATVDDYTKMLFKADKGYVETEFKDIDYSLSTVKIGDDFNFFSFESWVSHQPAEHGIFFSTRVDLVRQCVEKGEIGGYKVITDPTKFKEGKKQILAGSNGILQGLDIGSVGFIVINKLPFKSYNDSYRKRSAYLASQGIDPYNGYAIPYVVNQLIQGMGRIWRKPGDKGNIIVFDSRAKDKHNHIFKKAISVREGIRVV